MGSHSQGSPVGQEMKFGYSFSLTESNPADFGIQTVRLVCYRGSLSEIEWVDQDPCKLLKFFVSRSRPDIRNCSIVLHILFYLRGPKRSSQESGPEENSFPPCLLPTGL